MLVPDYLWQFVFSALKCKLFQLSSAPYPVGREGVPLVLVVVKPLGATYSMIFWKAV